MKGRCGMGMETESRVLRDMHLKQRREGREMGGVRTNNWGFRMDDTEMEGVRGGEDGHDRD